VDHHSGRSTVDKRWGTVERSPKLVLADDSRHKASLRDGLAVEGDAGDLTLRQTTIECDGWSAKGVR
jgi:hypothetical protein